MSLLCRNAWGRLAILAAIAAALGACGAGPGAKEQPDPVKIPDVSRLDIGNTHNVSLVNKFSGEGLTYTAKPSDTAVATVKVDNAEDILTVTAVGEGKATITVTAADSQDRTASQTFSVTVPKPTTSEPEPGAPTVRTGAPTSVDFEQGGSTTATVILSRVFEGENLTYSAPESDDTDVAIASISNGVLIIRAGDPGEATITVIATNAKGEAAHEITVTVPEPEDDGDGDDPASQPSTTCNVPPLTITITIRLDERTKKCTIPQDYSLKGPYDDEDAAAQKIKAEKSKDGEPANVWDITVKERGTYTVVIFDKAGIRKGSITVKVPNSRPIRKDNDPEPISLTEAYFSASLAGAQELSNFFMDPDTAAGDTLRYRIQNKPNWVLIETDRAGFVDTGTTSNTTTLKVEVLKKVDAKDNFLVVLYASDDRGDESNLPVTLNFENGLTDLPPRSMDYTVYQDISTGTLSAEEDSERAALKVGERLGVPHTLIFDKEFQFSRLKVEELKTAVNLAADPLAPTLYYVRKNKYFAAGSETGLPSLPYSSWNSGSTALGTSLYILRSSSPVEAKWSTSALASPPEVTFTLTGKGSGSITIEYYVWVGRKDLNGNPPSAGDHRDHATHQRLSLIVIACNSPPDLVDKCDEGVASES